MAPSGPKVREEGFFDFPRRDPHDVDRVADHVGGALLAFRASGMLILLLLMRRVEKRVYDSHRLRDHLLSLCLILGIGKFRAIEKRSRFSNARFETGLV
jgi:hypothetical protein